MTDTLISLFRYQAWANTAFFEAMAMSDPTRHPEEYREASRLMSHIQIVADIFAAHLRGRPHAHDTDAAKDAPDLATLRVEMAVLDAWYVDYAGLVSPQELCESVAFAFTDGDRGFMSRREMLTHVVLHGAYHRGEVGRILTRAGLPTPWDTYAVFLHRDQPRRRQQGVISDSDAPLEALRPS